MASTHTTCIVKNNNGEICGQETQNGSEYCEHHSHFMNGTPRYVIYIVNDDITVGDDVKSAFREYMTNLGFHFLGEDYIEGTMPDTFRFEMATLGDSVSHVRTLLENYPSFTIEKVRDTWTAEDVQLGES